MRRDERDVETADEEPGVEQPETAVDRRFTQRLARGLVGLGGEARPSVGTPRDPDRQHPAQRDEPSHDPKRLVVPDIAEQHRRQRHDQKLTERAARGHDAESAAPLFRTDDAPDRAEHDDKGGRRLCHADDDTEADMQPDRIGRKGRADQTDRVEQRSAQHDASGAMLVGERPDKRLNQAKQQILQRHREPEIRPADPDIDAHLRKEQAERLADAHRQRDDEGGAEDYDPRTFHKRVCGGAHGDAMRLPSLSVKRA